MSLQLKIVMDQLGEITDKKVKQLVLQIHSELVLSTPVKTGWARANWVPSIGVSFSTNQSSDNPNVAGLQATQQAAVAGMLSYTVKQGPVYISNNVPYMQRLNEGSSIQAPAAFIQASVARGVAKVKGGL